MLYCFASLLILYSGGDHAVEAAFSAVREDPSPRIVYGNPFRFPCCELLHFDSSQTVLNLHKVCCTLVCIDPPRRHGRLG